VLLALVGIQLVVFLGTLLGGSFSNPQTMQFWRWVTLVYLAATPVIVIFAALVVYQASRQRV
jgi:hypothetical protein